MAHGNMPGSRASKAQVISLSLHLSLSRSTFLISDLNISSLNCNYYYSFVAVPIVGPSR